MDEHKHYNYGEHIGSLEVTDGQMVYINQYSCGCLLLDLEEDSVVLSTEQAQQLIKLLQVALEE